MKETAVEGHLIRRVAELGGAQVKHTSPGTDGEPDRLVKLPGCPLAFLELKRPGAEPTPRQWERIEFWRGMGVVAEYADSFAGVEVFLRFVEKSRPLQPAFGGIKLSAADRAAGWTTPA